MFQCIKYFIDYLLLSTCKLRYCCSSPMLILIFITANFNSLLLLVHIIQATQYYTNSLDHTYHRYNH